jgi:hypothetical protein
LLTLAYVQCNNYDNLHIQFPWEKTIKPQ